MNVVKFLVVLPTENDSEQNTLIVCDDGGVATLHHNGEHIIAELYQNRITKDTDLSNMFDELGEGKMYIQDYPNDDVVHPSHIKDCAKWLYVADFDNLFSFEVVKEGEYNLSTFLKID
jgi:hypothetical protein